MRGVRKRRTWIIILLLVAINIPAIYTFARMRGWHSDRLVAGSLSHTAKKVQKAPIRLTPSDHYVGVAINSPFETRLHEFTHFLGRPPGIVEYYMGFGTKFPTARAVSLARQHSLSLIQLNPRHVRLADIAAGKDDTYLRSYAAAARDLRAPVAICFGHEMNGSWYPWGRTHSRPAAFVAAWRHIHRVFAAERASNVIWVWTISRGTAGGWRGLKQWWPGSKYVNWVGVDGYYRTPSQNFTTVFRNALKYLHKFTSKPELITETAVGPFGNRNKGIQDLVAGVERNHLLGLIWFDINAMERWVIDADTAASPLLRAEMTKFKPVAAAHHQKASH